MYPDGVALRVAGRLFGVDIPDDLVPALLSVERGRCFLIGATERNAARAGRTLERLYPAWSVVGAASGYLE